MVFTTPCQDANPIVQNQYIYPLYYEDSPSDSTLYTPRPFTSTVVFNTSTLVLPAMPPSYRAPFNMTGVFFTGLSTQTTLTINLRAYIEIFPSQLGNPLTPIAQPSAPYDETALKFVSEVMKEMPPGVMLCENGLGDWLADIAGKVSSFVSPIAGTVGKIAGALSGIVPGAGLVSNVANMIHAGTSSSSRGVESSSTMRDDGVVRAISNEKAMMRSEQRARKPKAAPRAQNVAVRQAAALAKLKARSAARVATISRKR